MSNMYIRTKDRIYQVESTLRDNGFVKGYNIGYMAFITKDQVINQSENLEELCDEFVMVDNSDNKPYRPFIIYGKSLEELNERQSCNESLYGAIWTSKGLIYVAKMDSDGKLVLI